MKTLSTEIEVIATGDYLFPPRIGDHFTFDKNGGGWFSTSIVTNIVKKYDCIFFKTQHGNCYQLS